MPLCKDPEKEKERRRKMSEAHKGKSPSAETRRKLSETMKGRSLSAEHRRKIGEAKKGKPAPNKGKPMSAEQRLKLSEAHKGRAPGNKGKPMSAEQRRKVSEAKKGKPSPKKGKQGKPHSAESRRKLSEAGLGGHWYGNVIYYDGPQYCEKFTPEFKERVRAYRGRICFECGTPENGKKLHVHHVHYDKDMCCNGSPRDVVPLCGSCHSATNFNRDYWEDHFTELIYNADPEGKCFFTKEEMRVYKGVKLPS